MITFPSVVIDHVEYEFFAAPSCAPDSAFAAIAFLWEGESVLLADIVDRGWCLPSGKVEPGETSLDTAFREAREEASVDAVDLSYFGFFRLSGPKSVTFADCYGGHFTPRLPRALSSDSQSTRLCCRADLPSTYYTWNPLFAKVFDFSLNSLLARYASQE